MRSIFKTHYKSGIWAEYYAWFYLFIKGYSILERRYKTKVGEIDLIARRGKTMCFVEVKYRSNLEDALDAVTLKSQKRIRKAAQFYLLGKKIESHTLRCDVIAINHRLRIRHIKNGF